MKHPKREQIKINDLKRLPWFFQLAEEDLSDCCGERITDEGRCSHCHEGVR